MVNNVDRVDPRELQSLQLYLNDYRQQAEIFTQQLALLEEGRMEALAAIEALEGAAAAPDSIVLLQIGGGVSVRARILDPDRVLLNIGADVIVERPNAAAQDYLKDRITEMEASAKKVAETLERLRVQMNELARRIELGYQQAQMAQMQPPPVPEAGEE
ncbi:MAG: prefoldin subunit alpha [Methanoregulaceae archaeon]|jgi:prefoldin alpha subunit|nr:prefoldin subunit alpha [Methanoregulaceae archaeon]MCC7467643.1 prefoldin subunit alpha [Burkholderiaceae bacterium]NLH24918.1 prefoldin subunit alpha [Methanomicrobiales archaeon]HPA08613.1 prefoldin subunit alpha [Methanoregulaceae archaeon]HPS22167.1 prefoldin subunit alpha [Methanoregulaceae archaeon]